MAENILNVKIKQKNDTEANWSSANPILLKGEIAISSDKKLFKVGDGTSTWSELSYNNANSSNSSTTATTLATARTIRTNLASTSTASFDGSANITPGVTGTLPVANGGTGQTTLVAAANSLINGLGAGDTEPTDDTTVVVQGVGSYTSNFYRKPISLIWNYIKGKISSVLGLTSSSYGGNSATATSLTTSAGSATQPIYFSDGKPVATTYTLGKSVPSSAVFTDTHYASKNVVGSSTATSNTSSALTNGNVYLNSVENGAVTSAHKISGSGATTVTTDTSGNIVITSTDNNTTYTAGTGLTLSGTQFKHSNSVTAGTAQGDASKTLTFGGTFTVPTVSYDATGHVTGKGATTMTMPSNIGTTSISGLTKLYTATGRATDGTMTQNAITTELNNKSKVTIVRWT